MICSIFGVIQISLFSRERHVFLIFITLVHYVFLAYIIFLNTESLVNKVFVMLIPSIIGFILLQLSVGRHMYSDHHYLQWVKLVLEEKQKKNLLIIKLVGNIPVSVKRHSIDQFSAIVGHDALCSYYKDHVFIVSDFVGQHADLIQRILIAGMGYVVNTQQHIASNGLEVLKYLRKNLMVPAFEPEKDLDSIVSYFLKIFPNGLVQYPTNRNKLVLESIPRDEQQLVTRNVLAYAQGNQISSDTNWFVTSLQNKGFIDVIFLVRKSDASPSQRSSWINYLAGNTN
jgi:hypothetical protein